MNLKILSYIYFNKQLKSAYYLYKYIQKHDLSYIKNQNDEKLTKSEGIIYYLYFLLFRKLLFSKVTLIKTLKKRRIPINSTRIKEKIRTFLMKTYKNYPIQYEIGYWFFYGNKIFCQSPILIPRIETEMMISLSQRLNFHEKKDFSYIEVGVGTGCVLISILKSMIYNLTVVEGDLESKVKYKVNAYGIDINQKCIDLSYKNLLFNMKNLIFQSEYSQISKKDYKINIKYRNLSVESRLNPSSYEDFLNKTSEKFDFLISNPPYIPIHDKYSSKIGSNTKYEADNALYSGEDGLNMIRKIIYTSCRLVNDGGFVIIEFGDGQKESIKEFIDKTNKKNKIKKGYCFYKDLYGKERFLVYYIDYSI